MLLNGPPYQPRWTLHNMLTSCYTVIRPQEADYRNSSCSSSNHPPPLTLTLWTKRKRKHETTAQSTGHNEDYNSFNAVQIPLARPGGHEIREVTLFLAFFSILEPLHKLLHLFQEDTLPFGSMGIFVPL